MLHVAVALCQPGSHFFRVILERTVAALVGNAAVLVNDVQALRPGRIRVVRRIIHFVNPEGQWELEPPGEIVGDNNSLLECLGLHIADVVFVFFIRLHSPFVRGMRFTNVDRQKIGVILVIAIDLHNIAQLATEGRSGKTAEDQHQRPPARAFMKTEARFSIQRHQSHIGRRVACL